MILLNRLFLASMLFLAASAEAYGWLRPRHEDAIVVERSELIVVGRLDGKSIRKVMHPESPSGAKSWEYHATLLVSEALKGKVAPGTEIPIILHYGLSPAPDVSRGDGRIGLYDSGNSAVSLSPLIADVQADNLWFLRRRSGEYGREPGTGKYGVVDPEDVQALEWKEYFLAYLSSDPAAEVERYARANPERGHRAESYLAHLEIRRILKIEDPGERFDRLQPYFLSHTSWDGKWEAKEGVLGCGFLAGERLKKLFFDPRYHERRGDIILMWGKLGYQDAVPVLIYLLQKHDRYWKRQRLEKDWWNRDSVETRQRREIYMEVYYAVSTLRRLQDPRSRAVLEMTRDRWKKIVFGNPQIVEECEAALKALAELEKASPAALW